MIPKGQLTEEISEKVDVESVVANLVEEIAAI